LQRNRARREQSTARVETMRERGTIVRWFDDDGRNYGFIRPDITTFAGDVFLHGKQIVSGTPREGAIVEFEVSIGGNRKRLVADNAEILQEMNSEQPHSTGRSVH
jgi:cold shock CspA family protein